MSTKKLKHRNKPRKTHYKKKSKYNHKTRKFYGKGQGKSKPTQNDEDSLLESKSKLKLKPNGNDLDLPVPPSIKQKSKTPKNTRSSSSCLGSGCSNHKQQVSPQGPPPVPSLGLKPTISISGIDIGIPNRELDNTTIDIIDHIYNLNHDIYTINNMIYRLIKISGYSEMIILGKKTSKKYELFQTEVQKLVDYISNNNLKLINETVFTKKNKLLKYYTYKSPAHILKTNNDDFYEILTNNNDLFELTVQIIQISYGKIFIENNFSKRINFIYLFQMNIFLIVHFYLGYLNSFIELYSNDKINTVLNTKTDLNIINKRQGNISKIMTQISDYYVKIEGKNNFEDTMSKMIMFKNINSLLKNINSFIITIDDAIIRTDNNYFIKINNLILKINNLQDEIIKQINFFDSIKTTIYHKQEQEKYIMREADNEMKSFIKTENEQNQNEINLMHIEGERSKLLPKTPYTKPKPRKIIRKGQPPPPLNTEFEKRMNNLSLMKLLEHMTDFLQEPHTSNEKKIYCKKLFMYKLMLHNITLHDIYTKFKEKHVSLSLTETDINKDMDLETILKKIKTKYLWTSVRLHPDKNKAKITQDEKKEIFQQIQINFNYLTVIYTHYFKINEFIEKYSNDTIIDNFKKFFKTFILEIKDLVRVKEDDNYDLEALNELLALYDLSIE